MYACSCLVERSWRFGLPLVLASIKGQLACRDWNSNIYSSADPLAESGIRYRCQYYCTAAFVVEILIQGLKTFEENNHHVYAAAF